MTSSRLRMTVLAIFIAVALGGAVGGLSQISAVNVADPRPSVPPPVTPTLAPSPTTAQSATESSTPATTSSPPAQGGSVWLYAISFGDSISGLAVRFGTTTEDLLTLNPEYADNQDLLEVGAKMSVPCTPIALAEARC